ncbi:histidine--tRNA ligase [Candidatus Parcubacteria bacterium]|nr:histidine--tRNA ligase [Candidatus Parcubacteria bacterium]
MPKFQTPKGMSDILPEDWFYFQKILEKVQEIVSYYGFERIETPILEETELFNRGVGLATDIVQKEMFSFRTKGKDHLSLRPEGTAPIVRAYFQHGFGTKIQPVKLWYFGPFFRYEKPQAGRKRQFWQVGIEILGEGNPILDVQTIFIFWNILKELKIENLVLDINSLGDNFCRPYYKKALSSYFKAKIAGLCPFCKIRLKQNPLRILDCKDERCRQIISSAPQILDYLCDNCKNHFKKVLEYLESLQIPFNLNPYLVRGLDYYTKTVFEIKTTEKEIGALVGGGRYDLLGKMIGGKELPGVGGAAGIERIVEVLKEKKKILPKQRECKFFFAQIGELAKREALKIIEELRKNKIEVAEALGKDSLKAQMRTAEKCKAKYVLILGQKEAMLKEIIIKDMVSGKQKVVKLKKLVRELKNLS